MQRAWILTALLVSACFVAFESSAWAFQRMLVPPITTVSIPAFSQTEIPEAVVVDEGSGKSVDLEEAIDKGMVSVIGVSEREGESVDVRFDAVRVNNLTGNPVTIRVQKPVILAGVGDQPQPRTRETQMFSGLEVFSRYRVYGRLLGSDPWRLSELDPQQTIWKKMEECKKEAEEKGVSAEEFNEYMTTCILR
jgi:hypothetical protein